MPRGHCRFSKTRIVAQAKNLENNLGFQLLKIRLFGQTGDLKSAEAALKKLVELNPQEPGYRKLLVNFYVEQRRTRRCGTGNARPCGREFLRFGSRLGSGPISVHDQKGSGGRTARTQRAHRCRRRGFSVSDGSGRHGSCRGQSRGRQTVARKADQHWQFARTRTDGKNRAGSNVSEQRGISIQPRSWRPMFCATILTTSPP